MTDRPIIFSAPMVCALLDGRKTMTRRPLYAKRKARNGVVPASASFLQDHPPPRGKLIDGFPDDIAPDEYWTLTGWHAVKLGDRLWVRESYAPRYFDGGKHAYRADWTEVAADLVKPPKWTPAIHIPRAASRLTLVVTAVKIEPVQSISEKDCLAEGVKGELLDEDTGEVLSFGPVALMNFGRLWCDLNGEESWLANPDVVALTFAVHKTNIDAMSEAA